MTTVEVLAPLRLETRFVPPAQRTDGVNEWMLRLRVYPDEFSIRRHVAPPTPEELDRLRKSVARMSRRSAAARKPMPSPRSRPSVGASRALGAVARARRDRRCGGQLVVDRTGEARARTVRRARARPDCRRNSRCGSFTPTARGSWPTTLTPNLAEIGNDLDLQTLFDDQPTLAPANCPRRGGCRTRARSRMSALRVDIDIGVDPADARRAGRARHRRQPTPPTSSTRTTRGGRMARARARHADQHRRGRADDGLRRAMPTRSFRSCTSTRRRRCRPRVVLGGLTGRVAPDALPMLGGDLDYFGPGSLAVQGFWPVLWGRALRDVIGAGDERNRARALGDQQPRRRRATARVPRRRAAVWPAADLHVRARGSMHRATIRSPASRRASASGRLPWRAGRAAAARAARGRVHRCGHGRLARCARRARADALLAGAGDRRSLRAAGAARCVRACRRSTRHGTTTPHARCATWPSPIAPIGRAPGEGPIPGPPLDEMEDLELLRSLPAMEPEPLFGLGGRSSDSSAI